MLFGSFPATVSLETRPPSRSAAKQNNSAYNSEGSVKFVDFANWNVAEM